MNIEILSLIRTEAQGFISFLQLKSKPQIIFVEKKDVPEVKVNEFYPEANVIYFNTAFLQNLTVQFAILIVLHEIFHHSKQGIKRVKDVSEMRYGFLWSFMQLYDIEADVKVVAYLISRKQLFSFYQYLSVLYQGTSVFRDPMVRLPKLERFMGSLITVKFLFDNSRTMLFLPKLYLNWLMLISVNFKEGTMRFNGFEISTADIEQWKGAYQDAGIMQEEEYCNLITALADSLLLKIINEQNEDQNEIYPEPAE